MASKFKPGIPDNFTFDVPPVNDLGDYLDERRPTPPVARRADDTAPAVKVPSPAFPQPRVSAPAPEPVRPPPDRLPPQNVDVPRPVISAPVAAVVSPPAHAEEERQRPPRHTGPRREINMSPDTQRMSDELLELICSGSGQRDTKASELFHALVLLVFEVKDELDLHVIPKRGRWGSPTARAYPLELKNAFRRALQTRTSE